MDAPEFDIAVITVAYDNLDEGYLTSLAQAIATTRHRIHVVLVDNASPTQRLPELVERHLPSAELILRDGNHGMGRSTNFGAERANAKFFFILNPDTRLTDPDIFDKLVTYMTTHPSTGIAAPRIQNFDGSRQDTCRRFPAWYHPIPMRTPVGNSGWGSSYVRRYLMHDFDQASDRHVDWVQGSAMFIPADVWRELGGFDDRFWMYFEDIDLCRRVWRSGRSVAYVPHVTLLHAFGRASAKIQNPVLNILRSKMTRAHVSSWWKYLWKWRLQSGPTASQ